jgi:adenylyltransferase/sulfurtransferase
LGYPEKNVNHHEIQKVIFMKTELTEHELDLYSRQISLSDIDYDGQLRLRNSEIAIVGIGGLGTLIAQRCAGMGIGRIRIIDRDVVSRSDLHRQYLYDVSSVGLPKVEVAAKRLSDLNPDVEIIPFAEAVNQSNVERLIKGVDLVLDGLDGPESRYIVNRACIRFKVPFIFGAAIETYGNVGPIIPGDTYCLECFMPGLKDDDLPKCAVVGVHPSALGIITSLQVYEAVRILTGKEPVLKNRLLYIDLKEMRFQSLRIEKSETCRVCGSTPEGDPLPIKEREIEETCSRDGKRNFVLTPRSGMDLDLSVLREIIKKQGHRIKNAGEYGITYETGAGISVSILKSGIMIGQAPPQIKGDPLKDLINEYRYLLVDCMGVPRDILPEIT